MGEGRLVALCSFGAIHSHARIHVSRGTHRSACRLTVCEGSASCLCFGTVRCVRDRLLGIHPEPRCSSLCRRGLLNLVQQRRKLLKYLKRRDVEAYLQCLAKFDIRALKAQSRR